MAQLKSPQLSFFCLSYLILELFLIPHLLLAYDEFWFGQHIFQYVTRLPYLDFLPYKTVLGYYLLSLPMRFVNSLLTPLYLIKCEIAIINTFFLYGIGYYSARFFDKRAILFTLIIITANQFFLFYSVDLRVDMLATWLGLVAVLFVLYNKHVIAGLIVGLSFLVSQKAFWFFVATNVGYIALFSSSGTRKEIILNCLRFNISTAFLILAYVLAWSFVADPQTVLNSVFYEAYTQSKIHWYSQAYFSYWKMIIANGPIFFLLIPLTLLSLSPLNSSNRFLIAYSITLLGLLISYQQAFPYNMVFAVPAFFFLYANFFSELFNIILPTQNESMRTTKEETLCRSSFWNSPLPASSGKSGRIFFKNTFFTLGGIYIFLLLLIFKWFEVALPYYLICLIPLCLYLYITKANQSAKLIMILAIFFTGIVYPLIRVTEFTFALNNDYQNFNVALTSELLKSEGDYIAGTPLLYDKQQPIPGLENLISPQIAYLYTGSNKLLPILLPCLHLAAVSESEVISHLKTKPVKIYINDNRMFNLPPFLLHYLHSEFSHYWGSVYIYTPTISRSQKEFVIKFKGMYQVLAPRNATIYIDQQKVSSNHLVEFNTLKHSTVASQSYRLKLIPQISFPLEQKFQEDMWQKIAY